MLWLGGIRAHPQCRDRSEVYTVASRNHLFFQSRNQPSPSPQSSPHLRNSSGPRASDRNPSLAFRFHERAFVAAPHRDRRIRPVGICVSDLLACARSHLAHGLDCSTTAAGLSPTSAPACAQTLPRSGCGGILHADEEDFRAHFRSMTTLSLLSPHQSRRTHARLRRGPSTDRRDTPTGRRPDTAPAPAPRGIHRRFANRPRTAPQTDHAAHNCRGKSLLLCARRNVKDHKRDKRRRLSTNDCIAVRQAAFRRVGLSTIKLARTRLQAATECTAPPFPENGATSESDRHRAFKCAGSPSAKKRHATSPNVARPPTCETAPCCTVSMTTAPVPAKRESAERFGGERLNI